MLRTLAKSNFPVLFAFIKGKMPIKTLIFR